VLYFGQYLPLHGLDVIVDAVGRLATRTDLRFVFIGTGEERARIEPLVRATRADVEFVSWVPYGELGARIASADIVLGIFGSSAKAAMVIPNKVYEAAAMGCAVVTADTPAIREVFTSGRDSRPAPRTERPWPPRWGGSPTTRRCAAAWARMRPPSWPSASAMHSSAGPGAPCSTRITAPATRSPSSASRS
jgi:hypothetical protein